MTVQPIISRFFKRVKTNECKDLAAGVKSVGKGTDDSNNVFDKALGEGRTDPQCVLENIASYPGIDLPSERGNLDNTDKEKEEEEEPVIANAKRDKRRLSPSFDDESFNDNAIRKNNQSIVAAGDLHMKLTPLDQQIKELKESHMDKLLVVRVGYKYKCFAQDAVIASRVLQIKLITGKLTFDNSNPRDAGFKQFAYCSFPDTRLNVHLERLVHHDLKVGVVEQSETSAIKKYSKEKSKSQVFQRRVTNSFSKATYGINNIFPPSSGSVLGENNSIWALSITCSSNNLSSYALISVNLNKGEVIHDRFEESSLSIDKLETRLRYLDPKEIISDQKFSDRIKQCFLKKSCVVHENALSATPIDKVKDICEKFHLNKSQQNMVALLFGYVKDYGNETILLMSSTYKPFASSEHMLLNSNTFQSLDIFSNEGNKGSLFWVLDHTRTSFGSRELKEWVSKPLLNRSQIEDRLDAIDCIKSEVNHLFFESFNRILKGSPDLLRTLNRIAYGSTSRKEVYHFLKQISLLTTHFELHSDFLNNRLNPNEGKIRKNSRLLSKILAEMLHYSSNATIVQLLSMINSSAVLEKDTERAITEYFNLNNYDHSETIIQRQRQISAVQDELSDELKSIKKLLQRPHMDFKDKVDYLIEIRNTQIMKLPSDWVKVNSTKMVSRFLTPNTMRLVEKLQYHKDLLLHEADEEFGRFLSRIKEEYAHLRNYLENIAAYDAILALAATSCNQGYVRPTFSAKKQFIKAINARNPVIESLDVNYVPNDINMNDEDAKVLILTGPNMGGKSSYVRKVALLVTLAQIGSFVPADYFELSIFDSIFTRIGAYDELLRGESTFKVEMLDIMHIIQSYSDSSLILLDEVGRGTSTEDGKAIAYSLLRYFLESPDCPLILFTTHYPLLGTISNKLLKNYYMDYEEEKKPGENWSSVVFLYKLRPGIAGNSFGLNVAKLAGIDKGIINKAFKISETMRGDVLSGEFMALPLRIKSIISSDALSSSEKVMQLLDIDKQ